MIKKHILCFLALLCTSILSAQTLTQAKKLFDKGDCEKSKTAFAKFIKSSPSNAEYNYYYGASLYETGELNKSVPYLEKSAKRKYIGAYRYLGKAYADLYRFDEAVENYETHIEWLEEKNRDTETAQTELSEILKRSRMFKSAEKVIVIDSIIVNKATFLEAYNISASSGHILWNDDNNGTIHENELGNKRILSEMTDDKMQLYTQAKLLNGWGEKHEIESLNDLGNVNYPFMLGDGVTLYFASDGEGSLGGYDIFVTRYDSEDKTYLRPSNIGMPFNSTANDYLYVIDELNNLGWFVTDRNQPADSVCVYVFIPNESKQSYNYEATDLQVIIDAATLRNIRTTWTDMNEVNAALSRLEKAKNVEVTEVRINDFHFIINDQLTYHTWTDFHSKEAKNKYQELMQKEKDLSFLSYTLQNKRDQYAGANEKERKEITPSILDLEKRIPQLMREIEQLTKEVRRLEIEKLRK
jgi:tetratricopeptide (TPR) repeat protein